MTNHTEHLAAIHSIATQMREGISHMYAEEAAGIDALDIITEVIQEQGSRLSEDDIRDLWTVMGTESSAGYETPMLAVHALENTPQDVRIAIEEDGNYLRALILEDGSIFDPFYAGDRKAGAFLHAQAIEVRKSGKYVGQLSDFLTDEVEEFDHADGYRFVNTATLDFSDEKLPTFVINGVIRAFKGVDVSYPYMATMAEEFEAVHGCMCPDPH